jgi:hypothetical protein
MGASLTLRADLHPNKAKTGLVWEPRACGARIYFLGRVYGTSKLVP